MSEDLPIASLEGIPTRKDGEEWRGHAFVPGGTALSLRGAVGVTLMFQLAGGHPRIGDEQFMAKYQNHGHEYQDAELAVNGETYEAVEVTDRDLGVRVRAARVNGEVVIAVVPEGHGIPAVSLTWPE